MESTDLNRSTNRVWNGGLVTTPGTNHDGPAILTGTLPRWGVSADGRAADDETIVAIRGLGKVYEPTPRWMRLLVRTMIYQPVVALQDVDVDVPAGGICAVVGPNGAGKTSMFRILVGLTTPSAGTALVAGFDAHRESPRVRRLVGWMPAEDRSLFLRLNCFDNLHFHGRLHGIEQRSLRPRISQALDQVGLGGHEKVSAFGLSAGMRARLQLARALLTRPRLLILDEPTASVDPVGAHELLGLITSIVREHRMAALISSHRLEEIEALRSHVVLLDRGRVRFQGDLDELRARYDRPRIEFEFSSSSAADLAGVLLTEVGRLTRPTTRVVACDPRPGVTVGTLVTRLGATLTADLVRVAEVPLPLRDVLAKIYLSTPSAAGALQ
ncbi:MAG TPA: ABC transporter ATP-binding protein [Nitriliruptorales bacterium]|nr:ABC transporter ATP-binding protein [Nitriliruptorales bacterium]